MRSDSGFTLIEVLVVILIVGILAAIALTQLVPQQHKGEDAAAKTNARSVVAHVEACFTETETYEDCETGDTPGPGPLGVKIGNVAGGVTVVASGPRTYSITAHSESGNTFSIGRTDGSPLERTCDVPAAAPDQGGCSERPVGTW